MIYGIDLGTTYSAIAECNDRGEANIIGNPQALGATVNASVLYYDNMSGKPLVGNVAKNMMGSVDGMGQILRLFKREMGKEYCETQIQYQGEKRNVSPVEGSACILHYLMQCANRQRRDPIRKAVVTIPVSYTYQQRACVKKAAELAGIELMGLLHEPTAAAVAYGIQQDETILVFDLGGGTLDVSIVKLGKDENEKDKYEVLGIASDSNVLGEGKYIGGQDWDNALRDLALLDLSGLDTNNQYVQNRLSLISEDCKKMLSQLPQAPFRFDDKVANVKRSDFENMTLDLVEKCCQVVQLAIDDAQQKASEKGESLNINRFVLTGGSSNMPMIRRELKKRFHGKYAQGRKENEWIQLFAPEEAIAKGAAIYAHLVEQGKATFEEKSPYSYGTKCTVEIAGQSISCVRNLLFSTDPMVVTGRIVDFYSSNHRAVNVDVFENQEALEQFAFDESKCRLVGKQYDYLFDYDVDKYTPVHFTVTRDKDGLIGIVVSSEGHHEERFSIDTVTSPISPEVEAQIRRTIELMDQEQEEE